MMANIHEVQDVMNLLADRIRTHRKSLGWTQEQLADRAGLSVNFLARLELAEKTPSLTTLVQLSNALGVSVADLFDSSTPEVKLDQGEVITRVLQGLPESDVEILVGQLREMSDYLRHIRSEG